MSSKLQTIPEKLGILGWDKVMPVFAAAWVSKVPVVFIGDPGSAKSTFQVRFAKALDMKYELLDAQFLNQTRLLGIPNPDLLKQGLLEYVGGVIAKKPDLVIIDELTRMHDQTQGLLLEFIREGRLDQTYIACRRIANCNPPDLKSLVGVHHLDYAKATRMVYVTIPDLPRTLLKSFIENWEIIRTVSPETKVLCYEINELRLTKPPSFKFQNIAMSMLNFLSDYKVSGRQVDILLRLLSASYAIEESGLHSYSAEEIGQLGASIVPLQLTRNTWNITPELLAIQLAKNLPDYPWKQELKAEAKTISIKVEEAQIRYIGMTIDQLLPHIQGSALDNSIAFEILVQKIAGDEAWNKPFDNFESFMKSA